MDDGITERVLGRGGIVSVVGIGGLGLNKSYAAGLFVGGGKLVAIRVIGIGIAHAQRRSGGAQEVPFALVGGGAVAHGVFDGVGSAGGARCLYA